MNKKKHFKLQPFLADANLRCRHVRISVRDYAYNVTTREEVSEGRSIYNYRKSLENGKLHFMVTIIR